MYRRDAVSTKLLVVISLLLATEVSSMADEKRNDEGLAERGYAVLTTYCQKCHGDNFEYSGLDVRDRPSLLKQEPNPGEAPFMVPNKPEASRLWLRASVADPDQRMPPKDQPQPSATELADLKAWIEAGAEFPERKIVEKRVFIGERTLLATIAADLQTIPAGQRRDVRYFSLQHLWNNPSVSEEQLRFTRAAVSKLINSLSSEANIVVPAVVDADGLVLRINLRDYGWTPDNQWFQLISRYPYGLKVNSPDAEEVGNLTNCEIPYVRADWFAYTAPRPELYHKLLTLPGLNGLPTNVQALESYLEVSIVKDFNTNEARRAGFTGQKSGVSDNNRIVERHRALLGYYWSSYDSGGNEERQNFFKFPLGPKVEGIDPRFAFDHDGGEFIFSLPNRLQGYMLAKANGERLDAGPQNIVTDPNQFGGSYDILNGISCMGCHKHGIIPFQDSIRDIFKNKSDDVAEKVRRIYPPNSEFETDVQNDQRTFLAALESACGNFMRGPDEKNRDIRLFPDPITVIAKKYDAVLSLSDVARELGLPEDQSDADKFQILTTAGNLKIVIQGNGRLQQLELGPLSIEQTITRQQWERAFQPVANELGLGIPQIVF
jgi:mono/diheme cytochrome c family protein